jgi:hypothetical protein
MTRTERRFDRQFAALVRLVPALRGPLALLRRKGWRIVRMPLAFLFILGGLFSFLPVLGLWMLPFGLLLLAVDLPALRGPISALMVRGRRRIGRWALWWRARRNR